jgi:UDP-glucuronate 4-epimerase
VHEGGVHPLEHVALHRPAGERVDSANAAHAFTVVGRRGRFIKPYRSDADTFQVMTELFSSTGSRETGRTYVVTGCAGFIGSHLVEALLERGAAVRGIDCFTDFYPRAVKETNIAGARRHRRFELVEADLAKASLASLFDGADGLFHLAAQAGVRSSWGESFAVYLERNVLATQRVFEAAAVVGKRVVFASSSSVYGAAEAYPTPETTPPHPVSPYGTTKLACEHLARVYADTYGLDTVGLRYFTVYGPRQRPDMAFARVVDALATGSTFTLFGTGEQSRDFTYVSDAVDATLLAMERAPAGALYNVGGGHEATLGEAIEVCERLSGRTLSVRGEPGAAGDMQRTAADVNRIRSELGWSPAISLEQGLAAQLESRLGSLRPAGLRTRGHC